ncbi:hypothetical protein ACFU96_21880 [Streptomyces sp. NPDC057620]|uniref:hypothetical protein n=1 Tax=Streptomyces sp. NPDC057620 TaxID=3346185 RepID=UPI003678748C
MSETGQTWRRPFKAMAIEASEVRAWVNERAPHPDAVIVANELFIAVLAAGADVIEVTISTAGDRTRIVAVGPKPLPLRSSHGPGWLIVASLARITGLTEGECGLWAQLQKATP